MKFMCEFLPKIPKTGNIVSGSLLQGLADSLYTNIIFYNSKVKNPFSEFEPKQQIFPKPIVLEIKENNVQMLYTKSQAFYFANEEDKDKFEKNKEYEEKLNAYMEEIVSYKSATNKAFNLLDDLLKRISKFLTGVNHFLQSKESNKVKEALHDLYNPDLLCFNIRDNPLLKELITDFDSKIAEYKSYFKHEEELSKGFDSLRNYDPYKFGGRRAAKCIDCGSHCKPYKAYRFVCGHILHENCFEK